MSAEFRSRALSIDSTAECLRASWPAPRSWGSVLFLCVWLAFWLVGETVAIEQLLTRPLQSMPPAFFFWLTGWTLGGCLAWSSLVWQLFGREVVLMDGATLQHRIEALGMARSRVYAAAAVTALRATERFVPRWVRWPFFPPVFGAGWGSLAFNYGGTTCRLGLSLDEAEARQLAEQMANRLPKGLAEFQRLSCG